ncbi:MAG: putative toxin-antitoxin system toxin component, PIN family [Gemmataceae bacterium]
MNLAVFDCVVYVQAAINHQGPAASCLALVEKREVKVFASSAVFAEVRETLSQKKLRARFPHLTDERVDQFLQRIGELAEVVDIVPSVFSLPRDPDDAIYVDLALASRVPYLVSRDKDLLDLMHDVDFRRDYPGFTILDPVQFLSVVSPKTDEGASSS